MITIETVKKIPGFLKFEIKRAYIYFSFSWFSACSCSLWSVALLQLKTWRFKTLNRLTVESNLWLHWFHFTSLCDWSQKTQAIFSTKDIQSEIALIEWLNFTSLGDWSKKLTPVYQPMRFKTKTIAISSTVFACFHLKFWLASWIYFLCPDLRLILLWFWF